MEKKKEKISKQNKKTLKSMLIFIGVFIAVFVLVFLLIKPKTSINYEGMEFTRTQEGEVTFYVTSFDVIYNNKPAIYNFYLRNNPKKLARTIPFEGEIDLEKIVILNTTTENLFCEGYWNLATHLLSNLKTFGMQVGTDENATCDSEGRYMFIQIEEGNESKIEQFGPSCYKFIVSDCEILPVTERFMIETFVYVNERL